MLFYWYWMRTGREHMRYGADEFYMSENVLCSSYLRIFNSHTHTYLDVNTILL